MHKNCFFLVFLVSHVCTESTILKLTLIEGRISIKMGQKQNAHKTKTSKKNKEFHVKKRRLTKKVKRPNLSVKKKFILCILKGCGQKKNPLTSECFIVGITL